MAAPKPKSVDYDEFFYYRRHQHTVKRRPVVTSLWAALSTLKSGSRSCAPVCGGPLLARCLRRSRIVRRHTTTDSRACSPCGVHFDTVTDAFDHHRRKHRHDTITSNRCRCRQCYRTYSDVRGLRDHVRNGCDRRQAPPTAVCYVCAQRVTTQTLSVHFRIVHPGRRPYRCDRCTVRTFNNPSDKTKHSKICNAQQSTLAITDDDKQDETKTQRTETRIQTCASDAPVVGGSRPATCRICPHFYATSHKQLMGHFAELHPHERPFKCHTCTRTFIEDNKRRKHERDECKGTTSASSTPQPATMQPATDAVATSTPIDASIAIVVPDATVKSLGRVVPPAQAVTCRLCALMCDSHRRLGDHFMQMHTGAMPFACTHCAVATFRKDFQRRIHEKKCMAKNAVAATVSTPIPTQIHPTTATPQQTKQAEPALKRSPHRKSSAAIVQLRNSVNAAGTRVPSSTCRLCGVRRDTQSALAAHFRSAHPRHKLHKCANCQHTHNDTHHVCARHQRKNTDIKMPTLVAASTDDNEASENEQQHHRVKCLKNDCQLRFANTEELLRHVGAAHLNNNAQSVAKCPRCPVTCENDTLLNAHLITHNQSIDVIDLD